MNRWSPERRRRFALLVAGTLAALAIIWLGLISTLQNLLRARQTRIDSVQAELNLKESSAQRAAQYEADVATDTRRLRSLESQMAHGDIYRWVINHTLDLQERHDVTISTWLRPKEGEVEAPPAVPYKSGTYSLSGYGFFHNVGAFLADFENSSPFIRLKTLTLQSTAPGLVSAREAEKLSFQVDFITLVTTNPVARP